MVFKKFNIILSKGAMFGLDARVALVIFSSVGLISAASLYYAIDKSSVDKIIYEISQIDKAINAYELDTDSTLPIITTGVLEIGELVATAKAGAKQGYLDYDKVSGADANRYLVNKTVGRFSVFQANDRSATAITDDPYNECADANKACYLWVLFDSSTYGQFNLLHMNALDERLDGGDGMLTGRVQKFNSDGLLVRLSVRQYHP